MRPREDGPFDHAAPQGEGVAEEGEGLTSPWWPAVAPEKTGTLTTLLPSAEGGPKPAVAASRAHGGQLWKNVFFRCNQRCPWWPAVAPPRRPL